MKLGMTDIIACKRLTIGYTIYTSLRQV